MSTALAERVMRRVRKTDGCWEWTGTTVRGYGQVCVDSRGRYVHRVVYEMLVGPIPDGLTIDHVCRNRRCVNPAHLEPVTLRVNILRAPDGIAARNAAKTRCPAGHEYTAANTITSRVNGRKCRECNRAYGRVYMAAKRAAARAAA